MKILKNIKILTCCLAFGTLFLSCSAYSMEELNKLCNGVDQLKDTVKMDDDIERFRQFTEHTDKYLENKSKQWDENLEKLRKIFEKNKELSERFNELGKQHEEMIKNKNHDKNEVKKLEIEMIELLSQMLNKKDPDEYLIKLN